MVLYFRGKGGEFGIGLIVWLVVAGDSPAMCRPEKRGRVARDHINPSR